MRHPSTHSPRRALRRPRGPRRPAPLLVLAALVALLAAACSDSVPSEGFKEEVRRFRETHRMCNERNYRRPCQIGPDGRLYEYLPGEKDPP